MTASQVSNYSFVVCVFCKILLTIVLVALSLFMTENCTSWLGYPIIVYVCCSLRVTLTLSEFWCEFATGRVTITQTLDRIRLCFRIKVRFSDVSLV